MPKKSAHELIRRILDGRGAGAAKRALVSGGADSVRPILDALTGDHGSVHPDNQARATNDLFSVLAEIAKRNSKHLVDATLHDAPCLNAVTWAIGHSSSGHARGFLKHVAEREDDALNDTIQYHSRRSRRKPTRKRKATKRKAAKKKTARRKKATKRKAAKKKIVRRKKATKRKAAKKKTVRRKKATKRRAAKKKTARKKKRARKS